MDSTRMVTGVEGDVDEDVGGRRGMDVNKRGTQMEEGRSSRCGHGRARMGAGVWIGLPVILWRPSRSRWAVAS